MRRRRRSTLAGHDGFIIADLSGGRAPEGRRCAARRGTLLFNAGAIDDRLREEDCRANVIHVAPTRSMLADALAQYLVWKQWQRWLLVVGSHDEDKLYADALRRSATRFGAKIVQERDLRGYRRRAPHRQRRDADPAPDAGVHPAGAGLRRARRRRRKRGLRRLPALSHLGPAAGRGLGGPGADELGRRARSMGRDAAAEPVRQAQFAAHDGAGHAGLDGGAHDRRGRLAHQFRRSQGGCSTSSRGPTSRSPPSRASS